MVFKKRPYTCPNCGKSGRLYTKRNSYVVFVCLSCGVLETAPNVVSLKQKLKEIKRANRRYFNA